MGDATLGSMTPGDEAALTWYFRDGQRRFQRSPHGAIVDRLERESLGWSQCRVCAGVGILEDEAAVTRHQRSGKSTERRSQWEVLEIRKDVDGSEAGPILHEMLVEVWAPVGIGSYCQLCKGTGVRPKSHGSQRCPDCAGLPKRAQHRCQTCGGSGRADLDARPGHAREEGGGIEVDGDTLRRFAVVSRRLAQLSRDHQDTLERYFGPLGEYWAGQSTQAGRLVAIQPKTGSGKRLLLRTRVKGDEATGATPEQRIDAQWALQVRDPRTWRYELLEASRREAQGKIEAARRAWHGVLATPGWRDVLSDVLDHIDDTAARVEVWNDQYRSAPATRCADGVYR